MCNRYNPLLTSLLTQLLFVEFSSTIQDNSSIDGGSTTREVLPKPPYIDIEDSQHNEIDDVLLDGIHDLENISDGESDNHAADPETQDALESPDAR